ncbi:MAG: ECF transporter S component [Sporomusaceae bacterium]|nr:ECF transporter S component [Sporomusaceae bacterium]
MKASRTMTTRDLIFIGILSALCVIATTIKIPLPTGGMVHLGSACLFTIAILFGGVYAGFAGAIGSAFFDLLLGFSPYTIWSFIIKGGAGFLAGWIARGVWPESSHNQFHNQQRPTSLWRALLGCIAAAIWTLGGYILAWWQVTGSLTIAFGNAPSSLITSGVGILAALLLAPKLKKALKL